jgi:deoxyadenosine/deoxycytidine kinase
MKVSISGNSGVGKSTLLSKLSDLGYKVCQEIVGGNKERPSGQDGGIETLLKNYYERMDKHSFLSLQEYFFETRINMFKEISEGGIVERCPGEDQVFLYNGCDNGIITLSEAEEFIRNNSQNVELPDVVVYLYNPFVKGLKSNIIKRGRECEMDITEDYLSKVEERYRQFMGKMEKRTKVLYVKSSEEEGFANAEEVMVKVKEIHEREEAQGCFWL